MIEKCLETLTENILKIEIFFMLQRLKYHTQVTVRSARGKNARGRKISGIEPMPGEDKVMLLIYNA